MKRYGITGLLFAFVALAIAQTLPAFAQLPPPSTAKPEFKERPFGPLPAPTRPPAAKPKDVEESEPLPLGWKVGIGVAIALAVAGLLYGASRAWHSSNLFDYQHRFPVGNDAALRFGGKRSGGHMATLSFGDRADARREPQPSEAKHG
jgi:hypothetical protein